MKRTIVVVAGLVFLGMGAYIFTTTQKGWEEIAAGALILMGSIFTGAGLFLSGARLNSISEAVIRGLP